jgi:hypothetical protein
MPAEPDASAIPDAAATVDLATPTDSALAPDELIVYPLDAAFCPIPDGGVPRLDAGNPTVDDIVAVCIRAASCLTTFGATIFFNVSTCATKLALGYASEPASARLVACRDALDCQSLVDCFGNSFISDTLLEGSYNWPGECQGTTIVYNEARFDCCSVGRTCVNEFMGDRAVCALGPCATEEEQCQGDIVESCFDGVLYRFDCAPFGTTCGIDQWGQTNCSVGKGAPCSNNDPDVCNGSVATRCIGGRLATLDCATQSPEKECREGYCVPPLVDGGGGGCLYGNAYCKGATMAVCVGDGWRNVDCRNLGFQTCAPLGNDARCR